jgi:HSP20 family protein
MRYRRMTYRYTTITHRAAWPLATPWRTELLTLVLGPSHWRPDADVCETRDGLEIVVDLAGVDEDDLDLQLFDDALVVEGQRRLPSCEAGAVYHAASVRQGPFRLEIPLPIAVDTDGVEARYDRGLLRLSLRRRKVEAR